MQSKSSKKQNSLLGLIGWLVLCFAASAIGAAATSQAETAYAGLTQPEWAPSGAVFGPVWMVLYALMGIAAWLVWRSGGFIRNGNALSLFILQLGVNALWSWVFFAWHEGVWAFANIILLWLLIVAVMLDFWRVRPLAGLLLLPYLAWVSFAAVLCFQMWQLNPGILG